MTQVRALLHLVPRDDSLPLIDAVAPLASDPDLTVMVRADNCFVGPASPHAATIETRGPAPLSVLVERCRRAIDTVRAHVDPGASMALIGQDISFLPVRPGSPSPFRFQYLMRRRHDFTHDSYLQRYRDVHSDFGIRTPNLDGYIQHHVDLERSAELAAATGLTDPASDSMSELHIASVEHFLEGVIAHPEVGKEAQEDEERFVDRAASFGFCLRVLQG